MSIFLGLQEIALEEFLSDFWTFLLGSNRVSGSQGEIYKNVDFEDPYHENASFGCLEVDPDFSLIFDFA